MTILKESIPDIVYTLILDGLNAIDPTDNTKQLKETIIKHGGQLVINSNMPLEYS